MRYAVRAVLRPEVHERTARTAPVAKCLVLPPAVVAKPPRSPVPFKGKQQAILHHTVALPRDSISPLGLEWTRRRRIEIVSSEIRTKVGLDPCKHLRARCTAAHLAQRQDQPLL